MAIEKALFTTQGDFQQAKGIQSFSDDPFLLYDGESSDFTEKGNPGTVPGIFRNAKSFVTGMAYAPPGSAGPTVKTRHLISFFMKLTPADVTTSAGWKILFTNRGWSKTNYGLHLAIFNGQLNARIYGTGGLIDLYTDGAVGQMPLKLVQADTLYHVVFKYDENDPYSLEVHLNDELWIYSGVKTANLNGITNNYLTIGDMPTGTTGTKTYVINGWIDEFMYFNGQHGSMPSIEILQTAYRQEMYNASWIDWWTEPGAMILGKKYGSGEFTDQIQTWTSPTIDLQEKFGDFGRVQLNFEQPAGTGIDVLTRSSANGNSWSSWVQASDDGMINSPNDRYLQIQVTFWTTDPAITPKVQDVQVLDYPKAKRLTLTSEPLILYADLDTGLERIGELANAYDIYIIEEIKGEETIEWKLASNDPKRKELGAEPVEMVARIGDKQFIVKEVTDKRDESGKKYTEFKGESMFYELRDAKVIEFEKVEVDAKTMIQAILSSPIEPIDWTFYKSEINTIKRTIRGEWKSCLELLREVEEIFGGELQFNTVEKTVSLVEKIGEDNGIRFYYNKNIKSIERNMHTYEMVTRLYLYGKNGMTIGSVNQQFPGQEYIENKTWVNALKLRNKTRIGKFSDGRYTIPQNLYDDGSKMLEEMSKPYVSYAMTVHVLSALSGHEHESIGLGDTVYAIEPEILYLTVESRIVRRKYNVRQPWKTEVELNQPKKELADANKRALDDAIEVLAESDPLDTTDVQQMTVFNHLLNSRAEDGTTYWEQSGTGIAIEPEGFSGGTSWRFDSGYGGFNALKQSIYGVSHRSAYTVSAYVSTEGTISRGASADAFVGIKVRVHYTEPDTDGKTYEDHFLAIPDITQENPGGE